MKNLDLHAAKASQDIITRTENQGANANNVENVITKALGVLQENGVYAALLYLYSRGGTEKPVAESARVRLLDLLPALNLPELYGYDVKNALQFLTDNVCNDLDRLLLVKQLWEQTLIYTRYAAKARGSTGG